MMPRRTTRRMKSRMKRSAERVDCSVFFIFLLIPERCLLALSTLCVISSTMADWTLTSSRMSSATVFRSATPAATCSSSSSIRWSFCWSWRKPSCVSMSGSSVSPKGSLLTGATDETTVPLLPPEKSSIRASVCLDANRRLSRASTSSMCLKTRSTISCRSSTSSPPFPRERAASLRCMSCRRLASSRTCLICCRMAFDIVTVCFEPAGPF
mmetsp:Transcript_42999/g.100764  ORF Transcript_42999/g.100764 Transcript_42999/m.100764 type:complete len:211 (-) Transcript_42999:249-881(-)